MDHLTAAYLLRSRGGIAAYFGLVVNGELVGDYSPLVANAGTLTLEELKAAALPVASALTGRPLLPAQLIVYPPVPDFAPESRASLAAVTAQPRLRAGQPIVLPPPAADGRERSAFFVVGVVLLAPAASTSPGHVADASPVAAAETPTKPLLLDEEAPAVVVAAGVPIATELLSTEPTPAEPTPAEPPQPEPAPAESTQAQQPEESSEADTAELQQATPPATDDGADEVPASAPLEPQRQRQPRPVPAYELIDDATLDEAARLLPTVTLLPPGSGGVVRLCPTLAEAGVVGALFESALAALVAAPVTLPQPPSMAAAAAAWLADTGAACNTAPVAAAAAAGSPAWLQPPATPPPLATRYLPAWTAQLPHVTPGDDASADMPTADATPTTPAAAAAVAVAAAIASSPLRVRLPWLETAPSRVTMAATGHPGYGIGAAAASASPSPCPALEAAVLHASMDALHSLFSGGGSRSGGGGGGACRFYAAPPVAFGLACPSAHVGHTLCVELIGCLQVAPASEPFFLGSPYHEAAVAALPDAHHFAASAAGDCVDLDSVRARWAVSRAGATAWTPDGVDVGDSTGARAFYRVLWWDAFPPAHRQRRFRQLHEAYAAYTSAVAAVAAGGSALPPALLPARLRYGAFAVLVTTPHVAGREASTDDLADAALAAQLGAGIAWLARHGLAHSTIGPGAVMVTDVDGAQAAVITDYDGLTALPAPVATPDELRAAYASVPWWAELPLLADAALAALET